ncbi:MAG: amidohydrolase family protein [Alphaproteobacteria bacterium]|nr:amidohydrolase family protein [Alphaproteobacteria bacterium]
METRLMVNYPPVPNPRPAKFAPPSGACDTHFHIYGPPHLYPYVENRRSTPPAAPIEHYLNMADVLGLERGVLVQPNVHGFETAVVTDAIARAPDRLRGVINANPDLGADEIAALHAGGVRGIRLNITHAHGKGFTREIFAAQIAKIAHLPWSVDLHCDLDSVVAHAEVLDSAALPVVIDHFARCDGARGTDDPDFRVMADLAAAGNVWIKIGGADRLMSRGAKYADIVAMARALIDRAPERIIWGTDWPHSEVWQPGKMPNDGDLLDMVADYAPDAGARRKILADNPAALYGFD